MRAPPSTEPKAKSPHQSTRQQLFFPKLKNEIYYICHPMEKFKTQTSFSETKFLCFNKLCITHTHTQRIHTHIQIQTQKRNDANLQFWRGGGGGKLREKKNLYISTDRFPSFFPHLELPRRKRLE